MTSPRWLRRDLRAIWNRGLGPEGIPPLGSPRSREESATLEADASAALDSESDHLAGRELVQRGWFAGESMAICLRRAAVELGLR